MINAEIPNHYTASPSSYAGTPHLTINAEAVADLDSSNAFEGPEKLLEVWFNPSPINLPERTAPHGLKSVPASTWEEMLDLVNCKVLSILKSDQVDAYLLSESSMFVFPHKLILKTCGTTTLLCGLPKILGIAGAVAGFPHVVGDLKAGIATAATPYRVFYSRKNFLFPDQQKGPHRSWQDEVQSLDRIFRRGSAYMIGKMNGEHWYLYLTEPNTIFTPPASPDSSETHTKYLDVPPSQAQQLCLGIDPLCQSDETLEILMTDLNQDNAKQFYLDHASAVAKGRYFQQVDEERVGGYSHKLTDSGIEMTEADKAGVDDIPDVFGNAYSEDGEFIALNEEQPFPLELTTEGHALGTVVSETSGLADVYPKAKYPQAQIDAYLFTPCGFSANGVIPASNGHSSTHYFTVHVTPEPNCSYASFETNVPCRQSGRETAEIVEQMVNIFKPGRFSVTLFETKDDVSDPVGVHVGAVDTRVLEQRKKAIAAGMDTIKGYRRVERIVHDLDEYDLVFRYYERWDWTGGEPRLREVF